MGWKLAYKRVCIDFVAQNVRVVNTKWKIDKSLSLGPFDSLSARWRRCSGDIE